MKKIITLSVVCTFLLSTISFSQTKPTPMANTQKQYVKFDVTDHLFMCPVLSPRFFNNLKNNHGGEDMVVSKDKNSLFFTIPKNSMVADSIRSLAIQSTIPANMITGVKISDTPFEMDTK